MANIVLTVPLIGATKTVSGVNRDNFFIEDTGVMLANYVLTHSGSVLLNRVITLWYKGNLDITTNNTNVFLFGHDISQEKLNKDGIFTFTHTGGSWDMMYTPDFEEIEFIAPEKLAPSLVTREITARVSYNSALSNLTYTLINPYNNAKLEKIYIKEYETLDDYGFIEIDHGLGGFAPFIIYTSATNGITLASPDKLKVPFGMTAGSYGEVEITSNYVQYQTDPFWQIGLSGPATLGSLELTFVFTILE